MSLSWGPTRPGRLFTQGENWRFTLHEHMFDLQIGSKKYTDTNAVLKGSRLNPGAFWATIELQVGAGVVPCLKGIPNVDARSMFESIVQAVRRIRVAELLADFDSTIKPLTSWVASSRTACKHQIGQKGWLTKDFIKSQLEARPANLADLLAEPEVVSHVSSLSQTIREAVAFWERDFQSVADGINARHLAKEIETEKDFFDRVEKSPLTAEQARAVVCFDNRVLLVASAGSGKTSTMVAKAGYALHKGYVEPEKMLLLAFNADAAAELAERIKKRLTPLGLPAEKVQAMTFHAFGLNVIGQATGKKPSIAPWIENGKDLETMLQLVDELKDSDPIFRINWDLFRIVFGQDLPEFGKEHESPDSWDKESRKEGFWTLKGDTVKSRGEQFIANWLFYNGVRYEYEKPYTIDTASAQHRQYRPDFYFPDIDVYLEHWALDQKGNPPPQFVGYKEGMTWKRQIHADNGTHLLETTMAELRSGQAFNYLTEELTKRGIVLDPNPDRPVSGRYPIENPRLARTFRTFLAHVKGNRLTMNDLRHRLDDGVAGSFQFRHFMFLSLFERIWVTWEARLRSNGQIDFDDMLGMAVDCMEQGKWQSPYELVMVDEFQDVSHARGRLVANLVKEPGRCLFAVGDDWQSINRFAGSNLAVMTEFSAKFGEATVLKLETTFRCSQALCEISSHFIQKNPKQLRKNVRSANRDTTIPIAIIEVEEEIQIRSAVTRRLQEIAQLARERGCPQRVFLLGRYRKHKEYLPLNFDTNLLEVEFVTIHSSKGLEADHVILPRITSETLGFPSRIEDDPILQLAMPDADPYEYAEERRLFYVALTRAKSTVSLITLRHKMSPFVAELIKDHKLATSSLNGENILRESCPDCENGMLVRRTSKYGNFLGCSCFPQCRYKKPI